MTSKQDAEPANERRNLPQAPVQRITRPLARFLKIEAASGILLGVCTAIALVAANTSSSTGWTAFWEAGLTLGTGSFELSYPRWYWVNDALMTVFFFVVGLEIKRELVEGHLRDRRKVVLPVVAALGGALVPAVIFAWFQFGSPGERGWAIPMATDIAFVVGALAVLGQRVPPGLKVLVLTLAIVDDLLAVGVIALFYVDTIYFGWLAGSIAGILLTVLLQKIGVRRVGIYVGVGAALWLCTLKSGVHPTIAGVVLGILTPTRPWISAPSIQELLVDAERVLEEAKLAGRKARATLEELAFAAKEAISPLERLESALHPWVGFAIMPIFALANAAVPITSGSLRDPLSLSIAAALFLGKPLGICFAAWVAIRFKKAALPAGVSWAALAGAGVLCGTGFTMSLFLTSLSFQDESLVPARMGVLLGSGASMAVGLIVLRLTLPKPSTSTGDPTTERLSAAQ